MKKNLRNRRGQTVFEYLIMTAVASALVVLIGSGLRRIRIHLQAKMTCEVAAACPGCPMPNADGEKDRINSISDGACGN